MQMQRIKCAERFNRATQVYEKCIGFLSKDLSSTELINKQVFIEVNILILQLTEEFCETPELFDFSSSYYSKESRPVDLSEGNGREIFLKNLKNMYEYASTKEESSTTQEDKCKEGLLRIFRCARFNFIEDNLNPINNLRMVETSLLGDLKEIYKYTLGKLYHFLQFQLDEEKNPHLRDDRLRHIQLKSFTNLSVKESYNRLNDSKNLNLIDIREILEKLAQTNDVDDIIYISTYSKIPNNMQGLRCMPYLYYKEPNSRQADIEKIAREIFVDKLSSLYKDVVKKSSASNIRRLLHSECKERIENSRGIVNKVINYFDIFIAIIVLKSTRDAEVLKLFENHRDYLINEIQSDKRYVDAYLMFKLLKLSPKIELN